MFQRLEVRNRYRDVTEISSVTQGREFLSTEILKQLRNVFICRYIIGGQPASSGRYLMPSSAPVLCSENCPELASGLTTPVLHTGFFSSGSVPRRFFTQFWSTLRQCQGPPVLPLCFPTEHEKSRKVKKINNSNCILQAEYIASSVRKVQDSCGDNELSSQNRGELAQNQFPGRFCAGSGSASSHSFRFSRVRTSYWNWASEPARTGRSDLLHYLLSLPQFPAVGLMRPVN
jgi:hypothetical protein